jgi:hypothetical protein
MNAFPKATITQRVIGSAPVYTADEIGEFVFFSDIPKKFKEDFGSWMVGQTVSGAIRESEVETIIFLHDWERWYNRVRLHKTTYFD